jgi:uncharacterized protein YjiS (DUF1127 family)
MSRAINLARATPLLSGFGPTLRDAVKAWATRRRERAMLARLDDHLLRDIGLDADTAARECRKPGWRA